MSKWFKITEKLPDREMAVLAFPKHGNIPTVCVHVSGTFYFLGDNVTNEIEYWMYLPESPNK